MQIKDVVQELEQFAPPSYQEDYDNSGLLTGNLSAECKGVLVALDCIESIVEEAINRGCNLIVAHHPILFKGLKKLTGKNYVERTIIKAIKNDIAIYAIHTNLDNVVMGVNGRIAGSIKLQNLKILQPRESLMKKLVTFVPVEKAEVVRAALFDAGAGKLGRYSECSFNSEGFGTFKAEQGADPYVGEIGQRHEEKELKVEVIFPAFKQQKIIQSLIKSHPYEEAAYDVLSLGNFFTDVGSGVYGTLEKELSEDEFLQQLKSTFDTGAVRHTILTGRKIRTVAVCGGAGIFLLNAAKGVKADAFVTSDVKYHEFFDADGDLLLADIGHFESEQFTIDLLHDILRQKFPNFAVLKTGLNTNPVHYL